jgi:hypothetical protein
MSIVRLLGQGTDSETSQVAAQMLAYMAGNSGFRASLVASGAVAALVTAMKKDARLAVDRWAVHVLCG